MESSVMGAPAIQNKVLTHLPIGTDNEEGVVVADATFDSEVAHSSVSGSPGTSDLELPFDFDDYAAFCCWLVCRALAQASGVTSLICRLVSVGRRVRTSRR